MAFEDSAASNESSKVLPKLVNIDSRSSIEDSPKQANQNIKLNPFQNFNIVENSSPQ